MTTLDDDRPHAVPATAFLRYKENYVFFIFSPETGVFGVAHFNNEPLFDRSRFVCNLQVGGETFEYANHIPFPEKFEGLPELNDGALRIQFLEPHQQFNLTLSNKDVDFEVELTRRFSTFSYNACRAAAPELASFQEVVTLGLNLPYNHQQQALTAKGSVKLRSSGKSFRISGYAYRDHSWVFRGDNTFQQHTWCGINFPNVAFGVKTALMTPRPTQWGKEGYVADAKGVRALRSINVVVSGEGPDGQPALFTHELQDVAGKSYTIEHNISGRHAHVPLLSEAATNKPAYFIVENFCPARLVETGDVGVSVVELGRQHALRGTPAKPLFAS